MTLKDQIITDMTAAMKAKDAGRTSTLRMIKAAIMNREKEGGGVVSVARQGAICGIERAARHIYVLSRGFVLHAGYVGCALRSVVSRRSSF